MGIVQLFYSIDLSVCFSHILRGIWFMTTQVLQFHFSHHSSCGNTALTPAPVVRHTMSFLAPPGTVIVLALACLTFLQASQAARFPRTVDEALQDYPQRRDDLIQVYVELTETQPLVYTFPQSCRIQGDRNGRGGSCRPKKGNASHPFGAFNQTGSQHSFRRMAAWLLAYKKRYQGRGDYRDLITNPKLLLHAPEMVFDWTKTIYKFARTGTDTNGGETDYDMGEYMFAVLWIWGKVAFLTPVPVMKEMISFLYLFQHEPTLLTDDAAFNILDKGLVYRGNDWGSHMRWKIATQGTFVTRPVPY